MKKYLVEPYIEQTYSLLIDQTNNYTADKTRSLISSDSSNDPNSIDTKITMPGNLNVNINVVDQQAGGVILINGRTIPPTTTNTIKYMKAVNVTNPFYPIGTDNTPTTKSYKKIKEDPPIIIPYIYNNILIYFLIGIFCILLILIFAFYFIL